MAAYSGPKIVSDNIVAHLDASNRKSYDGTGSTWFDISKFANHGNLINGPTYTNQLVKSIEFDSVDDKLSFPIACSKTRYSIDFWCYPTQLTDWNWAMGFDSFWNDFGLHSTAQGGVYVGTSTSSRISPWRNNVYVLNTWQNFTWTFDNGLGKFYKNGKLETSATLQLSSRSQFTYFNSGGSGPNNNCTGRLASLKIYNDRALSLAEIQQNFEATRTRYGV